MGKFKEHGVLMYLSNPLYLGFVKLQADKGLGRSFAALLPFVEGLYAMGYITERVYEQHKKRYSQPLIVEKPLSQFIDKEDETLNKTLGMVADQWEEHKKPSWRQKWLTIARSNLKLPNSKLVLEKEAEKVAIGGS